MLSPSAVSPGKRIELRVTTRSRSCPPTCPVTRHPRAFAESYSAPSLFARRGQLYPSQSVLVFSDAEPDLCCVDSDLFADERVLGAGVHVAERALESAALADRGGAGR